MTLAKTPSWKVNPGANAALQPYHLDAHADLFVPRDCGLIQFECPLATVRHAVSIAAVAGAPVIINPSPLAPEFLNAELPCDTMIANAHEATALTGATVAELEAQPQRTLAAARCRVWW